MEDLGIHIGEWRKARSMFAQNIPEDHAKELVDATLPDELKLEVARRGRELTSLATIVCLFRRR